MNYSNLNNPLYEYIKMRDRTDRAMRQHANPAAKLGTAINIVSTNSMDILSSNVTASAVALNKMSERALFSSSDTINNFLNSIEKIATLNQNILYYQVPKSIENMCINSSEHLFEAMVAFDLPEPISNDIKTSKEEIITYLGKGYLVLKEVMIIISFLISVLTYLQTPSTNEQIEVKQLEVNKAEIELESKKLEIKKIELEIEKKKLETSTAHEKDISELTHTLNTSIKTIIEEIESAE